MELLRALGALAEQPSAGTAAVAGVLGLDAPSPAAWHATFVERFYPYASVHLGGEGFIGGAVREHVAGLLTAVGAVAPQESDHLTVLLDAYASVVERGWDPPAAALLWEHLLPWTLPYLDRVARDGVGPYREWASLLTETLVDRAERTPRPPPVAGLAPIDPPGLADPRPGGDLVASLLAPVRLGAILTRDDLLDAADDLVLAPRMGERRYLLRALLQQDPVGMLGWLGDHAAQAGARTASWHPVTAALGAWWRRRAAASATLLAALAADAAQQRAVAEAP